MSNTITSSLLSCEGLSFGYPETNSKQVQGVSLHLRAGRCFGILGGNECGKTTLARLLLGEHGPDRGTITVLGAPLSRTAAPRWLFPLRVLAVAMAAVAGLLFALQPARFHATWKAGGWAPLLLVTLLDIAYQVHRKLTPSVGASIENGWAPPELLSRGVAYCSSEHDGGMKLPPERTVEETIGSHMPRGMTGDEKRREVVAALTASGFQVFTDSGTPVGSPEQYVADRLTVGALSGGQRHLVYLLSVLASQPQVLIADDMLCGLDIDRQSSVLQMLQTMQLEHGLSLLYMTVDFASFSIVAQEAAFMHGGRFVETGTVPQPQRPTRRPANAPACGARASRPPMVPARSPGARAAPPRQAHEMLEGTPAKRETRQYLQLAREQEAMSRGKNLRSAYRTGQSVFNL